MENTPYTRAEEILLEDFIGLIERCRKDGVEPILIGAYAIRLLVERSRPTNDLDIWINYAEFNYISSFLQELGYKIIKTESMFEAIKEKEGGRSVIQILRGEPGAETHIVGIILEADRNSFQKGFLKSGNKEIEVALPSLEGCLILKLWSMDIQSRPQDIIDIMNLLTYQSKEIDFPSFRKKILSAKLSELSEVLKQQIAKLAGWLNEGKLDMLWQDFQARRLLDRERRSITSTLKKLDNYLRGM